jgi:HupE / UreJ protein
VNADHRTRSTTPGPGAVVGREGPWPVARAALGVVAVCIMVLLGSGATASAHPISTTAILLDIGPDQAHATIQLPLDELGTALGKKLTAVSVLDPATLAEIRAYIGDHLAATDEQDRTWTSTVAGGRVENIDGVDQLVLDAALTPDTGAMSAFDLHYDAIIDRVPSHRVFVSARQGTTGDYTTLVMLSWQRTTVPVTATDASPSTGFNSAIGLGIDHIGSGSDHLLFIAMLLLPAPLLAARSTWRRNPDQRRAVRRVVHVVTAFTIGHSLTLALGAFGLLVLPTQLVECGIALSVLLSAVHAIRPLARSGEVIIAGTFGLLHGLAFASVLQQLDLTRAELLTNLLGFNIGIEVTQLCVVALVLPSLILLSRTTLYPAFRVGVASLGAFLATGWLLARIGIISNNPLEGVADLLVDHPIPLALTLAAVAMVAATIPQLRRSNDRSTRDVERNLVPVDTSAHIDTMARSRRQRLRHATTDVGTMTEARSS